MLMNGIDLIVVNMVSAANNDSNVFNGKTE